MSKEPNFIIFLYIKNDKFQIFLFDKKNLKNLYKNEISFQNNSNNIDFVNLPKFLDDNIYQIEKILGKFVENIFLILESDVNLNTNICIKKKFYNNLINEKNFQNILIDAKDLFKENYQEQNILHMIIGNYLIDGKNYSTFKTDIGSNNLSLEIKFISLPNDYKLKFIKIFEKYQIRLAGILCGYYIKSYLSENCHVLSELANKIINGYNSNEVILVPKNLKNRGIFEKFFQMFG